MRPIQPTYRRRSRWTAILGVASAVLMGIVGVAATILLLFPNLIFRSSETPKDPYLINIPVNVRPIPAYTKVKESDLTDPETRWFRYTTLPATAAVGQTLKGADATGAMVEGEVAEVIKGDQELVFKLSTGESIPHGNTWELGGVVIAPSAIVGRVVNKPKTPGLGFRETSFFPKGTPEGIAGATPPGMRGIVIPTENLTGVYMLKAGDHVDLIANVPGDELATFDRSFGGSLASAPLTLSSTSDGRKQKQTEPIMLAQNAVVLMPVHVREQPSTQANAKPTFEVAIAVDTRDVIPLQGALSKGLDVTCVAHSMQTVPESTADLEQQANLTTAPVTSRHIAAYEVVTIDHFRDPATRRIRYEKVDANAPQQLGVREALSDILGSVAKHDIPKGSFVSDLDLLSAPTPARSNDQTAKRSDPTTHHFHFASQPRRSDTPDSDGQAPTVVGERPGITSFIPPGRQAVTVPWNRIYGAEHLKIGDRIDLTITYVLESEARAAGPPPADASTSSQERRETRREWDETLGERAEPWFAAMDAIVIGPVGFPPPSAASRFLGESLYGQADSGNDEQRLTGPPIVLAIEPRDVVAVAAALATKDAMFAALFHSETPDSVADATQRRVVLSPTAIQAGEALTPDMLLLGYTRRQMIRRVHADEPFYRDALSPEDLQQYYGRYLKSRIRDGAFFTAADFHPAGYTPQGPDLQIPPVIETYLGDQVRTYTFE